MGKIITFGLAIIVTLATAASFAAIHELNDGRVQAMVGSVVK